MKTKIDNKIIEVFCKKVINGEYYILISIDGYAEYWELAKEFPSIDLDRIEWEN